MFEILESSDATDKGRLLATSVNQEDSYIIAKALSSYIPYSLYRVMKGASTIYLFREGSLVSLKRDRLRLKDL